MKRIPNLILLMAVIFMIFSCDRHSADRSDLTHIAMLVDSGHHAEALTALDSINERSLNECDRAHLHFLKAVSLDEYTHIDEAIILLRQSLRESEACANDSIAHKANLYLAYLNNISGNHTLAIEHAMSALNIARRHNNLSWEGAAYLQLSGSYHAKGMADSSQYYINRLISILDHQSHYDLPDMLNNIAVSFLNDNDITRARQYLTRSLGLRSHEHTYYLMAVTYQKEGKPDSAEMMWRKALGSENPYMQARISQAYAEWLKETGNFQLAASMMTRAQVIRDSLASRGLGEMAMSAHTSSVKQAVEERHRRSSFWYMLFSIGLLIVVGILWGCLRWKSKRTKRLSMSASLLSSQMEDMEVRMEELRSEIDVLHGQCERHNSDARELEKIVKEKSRQLKALEQKHAAKEREMKEMSTHIHEIESHHDEVMNVGGKKHAELMEGGKATQWTKNDMVLFVEYYYLIHPDFATVMRERYKSLSPTLAMIVILTHMGYDSQNIRDILGMSDGAYRTARSRINANANT